jgi:hypothetical protein
MNLLTPSQIRAAEIAAIHTETISFLQAQAKRSYHLLAAAPSPQEVLDAFGNQAGRAVVTYVTIREALAQMGEASDLPEADLTIFRPQSDGTVLYVPPVEEPPVEEPPAEEPPIEEPPAEEPPVEV